MKKYQLLTEFLYKSNDLPKTIRTGADEEGFWYEVTLPLVVGKLIFTSSDDDIHYAKGDSFSYTPITRKAFYKALKGVIK